MPDGLFAATGGAESNPRTTRKEAARWPTSGIDGFEGVKGSTI